MQHMQQESTDQTAISQIKKKHLQTSDNELDNKQVEIEPRFDPQ